MEFTSSALTGALRIGVQVASVYRGPHLEIYYELINRHGPEFEYSLPVGSRGTTIEKHKTRHQDTWIQFQLVNIGGQRAENIRLKRSGGFERRHGRDFGGLFEGTMPQLAPGQAVQLFLLDVHELDTIGEDGQVSGMISDDLIVTATYNSPGGIVNFLKTAWARMRGRRHHQTIFNFNARLVVGDLPPATYS